MNARFTPERLAAGQDFRSYIAAAQTNVDLWNAVYRLAPLPEGAAERAARIPGQWHLVALAEDWCGDAVNTLPVLAKLVESVSNLDLTIFGRDANSDLMDSHLSRTSRAIPVIIVLDDQFIEHGWWGSRPSELQKWFLSEGLKLEKTERYKQIRAWYARDRGRSIVDEVLSIVERGALTVDSARTDSTSHASTE
ncbi:MAG: thioredoxin family protein [Gemmatimonadaceae bacterium]